MISRSLNDHPVIRYRIGSHCTLCCHPKHTGRCNSKTGDRTDHDRIPESSCHIDVTLTYRIISGCCCRCDSRRTHTCLIGEHTSCNTIPHSSHHRRYYRTKCPTCNCLDTKCHRKDHDYTGWQIADITNNNYQTTDHIKDCHSRNHNRRYLGNALNSSYYDQQRTYCYDNADRRNRNVECFI